MQKTILITGSSRGIGAATALLAAERGYRVIVNYQHDRLAAEQVVNSIIGQGGAAAAIQADLGQEQDILSMFEQIDADFGPLYGLVNNAGIVGKHAPLTEIGLDRIRRIFEVNVFGAMLCAREAVKRMSTDSGGAGGVIVNVSSGASRIGSPNEYVDYAASKGAIDTFTVGLAKEVARQGIRVSCVRPGIVETDIHLQTGVPDRVARKSPNVPMGRAGQPAEIAHAILWLLSDEASYATGTILDVAGGI